MLEIARPRAPQHYADDLVFYATPKNPPPRDGEEGHTWLYPAIQVRNPGGYQAFPIPPTMAFVTVSADF